MARPMYFENLNGQAIPVPIIRADGSRREPDNRSIFTIDQAVEKFGLPPEMLRGMHEAIYDPEPAEPPTELVFQVSALDSFITRIMSGKLFFKGEEVLGTVSEKEKCIWLSEELPVDMRLEVLAHEIAHGHIFKNGFPAYDAESLCDFAAMLVRSVVRQLDAQGGEAALMAMVPQEGGLS